MYMCVRTHVHTAYAKQNIECCLSRTFTYTFFNKVPSPSLSLQRPLPSPPPYPASHGIPNAISKVGAGEQT